MKKLSVSAIAQPLTGSSDSSPSSDISKGALRISSDDEQQGDGGKFNWFSHWYPEAPEYDLDNRVPHAFTVMGLDIVVCPIWALTSLFGGANAARLGKFLMTVVLIEGLLCLKEG